MGLPVVPIFGLAGAVNPSEKNGLTFVKWGASYLVVDDQLLEIVPALLDL